MVSIRGHIGTSYYSSNRTNLNRIRPSSDLRVTAIEAYVYSGSPSQSPRIYDSVGNLIASGPSGSGAGSSWVAFPLTTPIVLESGLDYFIGTYGSFVVYSTGNATHTHSASGLTFTHTDEVRGISGDGFPTSSGGQNMEYGFGLVAESVAPVPGVTTLGYSGNIQNFVVPAGTTRLQIECWGASGGSATGGKGGKGGYAKGTIDVTPGETLAVYVGGYPGETGTSGWNGGGSGWRAGGGATDVRRGPTPLLIAGGGGGCGSGTSLGSSAGEGGAGGGTNGSNGVSAYNTGGYEGKGGTQSAPGGNSVDATQAGSGRNGGPGDSDSGGGGGGYFGGGGGASGGSGGSGAGGGSGYLNTGAGLTSTTLTSGVRVGPGKVVLTALNALPNAPTNVDVIESKAMVGDPVTVTWQHNDPNGNPQAKSQLRWRKAVV